MARRRAAAIVRNGFNRISPFTIWPNRRSRLRVQIVTKYAPARQGRGGPGPLPEADGTAMVLVWIRTSWFSARLLRAGSAFSAGDVAC